MDTFVPAGARGRTPCDFIPTLGTLLFQVGVPQAGDTWFLQKDAGTGAGDSTAGYLPSLLGIQTAYSRKIRGLLLSFVFLSPMTLSENLEKCFPWFLLIGSFRPWGLLTAWLRCVPINALALGKFQSEDIACHRLQSCPKGARGGDGTTPLCPSSKPLYHSFLSFSRSL